LGTIYHFTTKWLSFLITEVLNESNRHTRPCTRHVGPSGGEGKRGAVAAYFGAEMLQTPEALYEKYKALDIFAIIFAIDANLPIS
jgi:hypothetical protein